MNREKVLTLLIILANVLVFLILIWFASKLIRGNVTGAIVGGEVISEGEINLVKKEIHFTESIKTENESIIKASSKANNFLKYCIGVGVILGVILLFIKEFRKPHKK